MRIALVAVAVGASLSACAESDYCETFADSNTTFRSVSDGSTKIADAVETFDELESLAPEDLRDEWALVTDRVQALLEATEEKSASKVTQAYGALAEPDVAEAATEIQRYADQECEK